MIAMAATASGCLGSALGEGDDGSRDMGADAVSRFYTEVQPILTPACGGCHGVTGTQAPAFMLAQPDLLQNLLGYPGIVGSTPESSRLYMKGLHEGPAFTPEQAPVIRSWIELYNANRPMTDAGATAAPSIMPFAPMMGQTNSIDLAPLNASLTGIKITFTPSMVGTSLELANIKVVAPATTGVHIVHPLFVTWDQNLSPTPDPVDSFSALDQTVYAGQTAALGPGTLFLPNFASTSLVNIVFTTVEPKAGTGDMGTVSGCKAVAMFVANVKPLLQANTCSTNCHVGANPTAGLKFDATPDSTLCANALSEVDKTTPQNSRLVTKPNPAVADGHPLKIQNNYAAYQTAVINWINAEK
jgi:hypothetical protein